MNITSVDVVVIAKTVEGHQIETARLPNIAQYDFTRNDDANKLWDKVDEGSCLADTLKEAGEKAGKPPLLLLGVLRQVLSMHRALDSLLDRLTTDAGDAKEDAHQPLVDLIHDGGCAMGDIIHEADWLVKEHGNETEKKAAEQVKDAVTQSQTASPRRPIANHDKP